MNNAQLVTTAVKLDQSQKEYKSKLDAVKAEGKGFYSIRIHKP